jgi:hypothetical protein
MSVVLSVPSSRVTECLRGLCALQSQSFECESVSNCWWSSEPRRHGGAENTACALGCAAAAASPATVVTVRPRESVPGPLSAVACAARRGERSSPHCTLCRASWRRSTRVACQVCALAHARCARQLSVGAILLFPVRLVLLVVVGMIALVLCQVVCLLGRKSAGGDSGPIQGWRRCGHDARVRLLSAGG